MARRADRKRLGAFFDLARAVEVAPEFMDERPMNALPTERGIFDDDV